MTGGSIIQTNTTCAQLLAITYCTTLAARPTRRATSVKTTSGTIQVPTVTVASRRITEKRVANGTMAGATALVSATQPTIMAGSATTMAKKEFQNPSAEISSRR